MFLTIGRSGFRSRTRLDVYKYFDMATHLPDDILCKVDRASMAGALEVRCPLLDHRMIAFLELAAPAACRSSWRKTVAAERLKTIRPTAAVRASEDGFRNAHWPVAARAAARRGKKLISEERLRREWLFSSDLIREAWHQHLSGRRNH